MSRAGYSYDNAPIERYFNTLKTELLNVHKYSNLPSYFELRSSNEGKSFPCDIILKKIERGV